MRAGMVIVGAGECGLRAALALRSKGYEGPIDLIGSEPHLPYERPPLSKSVLAADGAPARFVAHRNQLAEARITHRVSLVTAVDRHRKRISLGDGDSLAYDRLLLATGARPRKLMHEGINIPGIAYLRTIEDCVSLRNRLPQGAELLVLGGGFLGLEIAAAARNRGAKVTVVETQPRILMRGVPEPIAEVVAARHATAGVEIHCGTAVGRIDTGAAGAAITLADGRTYLGDLLVASIGAIPNTELAAAAGLAVDNGIVVDTRLATTDPDIFAAGDCAAFPLASRDGRVVRLESWRNATDQAEIAAANMLGEATPHSAVPWFWSDQYELTLQVAGLADPDLQTVRRDLGDGAFILFHLDASGRLLAASGIGPGGAVARDIRLAEMLIARGARPDRTLLARADAKLKTMLAA